MFFLEGSSILNVPAGFDTGFSFSYSAINEPGLVTIYDDVNAAGNVIRSIELPLTPSDGGDPTGDFSPFMSVGVSIPDTAKSIDFGGTANQIGFDDITFGSATPGETFDFPFLIEDPATDPGYSSRVTTIYRDNEAETSTTGQFDPNAPTYVVSHGWQPSANFEDEDWDFQKRELPAGQQAVRDAILERIEEEQFSKNGNPIKANIVLFEWEGAYTGGEGNDGKTLRNGSRDARQNADYAGVLLGNALDHLFGSQIAQDIHFVGHSYGTIVNGLSARYLDGQNLLTDSPLVQFTTLDAPTNAPFGFAPNFGANWFQGNLPLKTDYLDNYYGTNGLGNLFAYGEAIHGAGLNQATDYSHGPVWSEFYPDLVANGGNAVTNPGLGSDTGQFAHLFDDWITPILDTFDGRPGEDFPTINTIRSPVSSEFEDAVGSSIMVSELPGHTEFAFSGLLLQEQSPVSVYQYIEIPFGAEWLSFEWMVGSFGDGDWVTMHFSDELLWSMALDEAIENLIMGSLVDVSAFAGDQDRLFFTLNSTGDANAEFYFGNLEFLTMEDSEPSRVSEPTSLAAMFLGLSGIGWIVRKRNRSENRWPT